MNIYREVDINFHITKFHLDRYYLDDFSSDYYGLSTELYIGKITPIFFVSYYSCRKSIIIKQKYEKRKNI